MCMNWMRWKGNMRLLKLNTKARSKEDRSSKQKIFKKFSLPVKFALYKH